MRVLWLCNIMLPVIAMHLGKEVNNKEGWLSGTYERLRKADFRTEGGERIELGVCFPVPSEQDEIRVSLVNLEVFGFYEDTNHPEIYDAGLESRLKRIVDKFNPDLIHCFGTEYPHTLAMTRAFPNPDKILVGIQGLCHLCAEEYMANLPENIQKKKTFRDILRKDSMLRQKEKFDIRGAYEIEALKRVKHVTGRTAWDKAAVAKVSDAKYHFMNETLRSTFYEGSWDVEQCIPHSVFLSQGDYPLKGLHHMISAMPVILKKYPDAVLYVAGNDLTKNSTFKQKIKISGYGNYLRKLIKKYDLSERIHFLGRLNADEMKARYLKSNLYVCASALENSPNSLGEAMLLGVPSLVSCTGGIPSVFEKNKDGLMFTPGDVGELAEQVIYLFDNPDKMLKFSVKAKEHAKIVHNPDANYERLLEIYREIV